MGLFNKIGREVEKFTQGAKAVADENAEYECASCGKRFYSVHDECPACGSTEVVALEGGETDATGTAEPDGSNGSDGTAENE